MNAYRNSVAYSPQQSTVAVVHHYAPRIYVPKIFTSGILRPSNAGAGNERPLLWFSANPKWEPTATKAVWDGGFPRHLTLAEQLERLGCCRFTLPADDPRLMSWIDACRFAGTPFTARRKMESVGRKAGGDWWQWFAVAESINLEELQFSVFDGRTWHAADLAEEAAAREGV